MLINATFYWFTSTCQSFNRRFLLVFFPVQSSEQFEFVEIHKYHSTGMNTYFARIFHANWISGTHQVFVNQFVDPLVNCLTLCVVHDRYFNILKLCRDKTLWNRNEMKCCSGIHFNSLQKKKLTFSQFSPASNNWLVVVKYHPSVRKTNW